MVIKRIVWFFGPSGAGKKTTIEQIISFRPELYSKILGLSSLRSIKKCEESFITSNSREDLAEIIPKKYKFSDIDCLFVKGQTKDLNKAIPERLRNQLARVIQEVVFLWVEPEELNDRRLKDKRLKEWGIGNHIHELKVQVEKMDKLRESGFSVAWIDNTGSHPKILTHDEVISRTEQLNKTG